jgi:transposase
MFTVELYAGIRRAVMVDGLSRREAAKRIGVHRNTITKMLQYSVPPGYRRRERAPSKKLGPYMAWIDKILEDDRNVHKKQRHTAHRIFERLRIEEGRFYCPLVRRHGHRAFGRRYAPARPARGTVARSASRALGIWAPGAYPRAWGCSPVFSSTPLPGELTVPITAWPPSPTLTC